ncbi:hypothetical protein [Nocardia transvalensis]|uniref:hypothetical protein n=1 Tax=Nocardia transvalensis TaxID=37333 RepID=UPI0018955626|nr:hypothetical protein [Nocardia transvalensis]MBF6327483.1 hypothetical protein [Nocardia transvalensis]
MSKRVSALASFAASVAVIGGICLINAGSASADPIAKFGSPEACDQAAAQRNAEYQSQHQDSTAPGITYYCEPYEWVENRSWGLYVRENPWP